MIVFLRDQAARDFECNLLMGGARIKMVHPGLQFKVSDLARFLQVTLPQPRGHNSALSRGFQVSDKELQRQLRRERERRHHTERKLRDARADADRMRVAASERPLSLDPGTSTGPTFQQIITPNQVGPVRPMYWF